MSEKVIDLIEGEDGIYVENGEIDFDGPADTTEPTRFKEAKVKRNKKRHYQISFRGEELDIEAEDSKFMNFIEGLSDGIGMVNKVVDTLSKRR